MEVNIKVKCHSPRYARGDYVPHSFIELYQWLTSIKGLSKGGLGALIFGIAKDGSYHGYTARENLEIKSDFHDYFLATDVARKVGLLGPWDKISRKREKMLAFVSHLDEELSKL